MFFARFRRFVIRSTSEGLPPTPTTSVTNVTPSAITTTGFNISFTPPQVGTWVGYGIYANNTPVAFGGGSPIAVTGLSPSTPYVITVVAFDPGYREGPTSVPINVTTSGVVAPPPVYTAPTAPGTATLVSAGEDFLEVSWTASASTDGLPILGYKLYLDGGVNQVGATTALGHVFTGLTPETTYNVRMRGYTSQLDSALSPASLLDTTDEVIEPPPPPPPPPPVDNLPPFVPASISANHTGNANTLGAIIVSCPVTTDQAQEGATASGVQKYRFYRRAGFNAPQLSDLVFEMLAGETEAGFAFYTDTDIIFGATYTYGVDVVDNNGNVSDMITTNVSVPFQSIWTSTDVGGSLPVGSITTSVTAPFLAGGGADIYGTSDQFFFGHQGVSGDWRVILRVTDLTNTHPYAKLGIMFRDGLTGSARFAGIFMTPSFGSRFQWRSTAGAAVQEVGGNTETMPRWLRLDRIGDTFTGYSSVDGTNWTSRGSTTIGLPAQLRWGIAICSSVQGTAATGGVTDLFAGPVPADETPPTVPEDLDVSVQGTSGLTWTWSASTDADSGVKDYIPVLDGVDQTPTPGLTFQLTGLSAGTTHSLRVRARDNLDNESANSTAVPGTTDAVAGTDPVFGTIPDIQFTLGTPAEFSYGALVSHPSGLPFDVTAVGTALPAGVTINDTLRRLVYSGGGSAAVTTGHVLRAVNASTGGVYSLDTIDTRYTIPFAYNKPVLPGMGAGATPVTNFFDVYTDAGLATALGVPGSQITIHPRTGGGQYPASITLTRTDQEIIIRAGAVLGNIRFGNGMRRIRIRGETPRVGSIHGLSRNATPDVWSDITLDGVNVDFTVHSTAPWADTGTGNNFSNATRFAMLNSRLICPGGGVFGYFLTDFIIANTLMNRAGANTGGNHSWRMGGAQRAVIVDCMSDWPVNSSILRVHTASRETDNVYIDNLKSQATGQAQLRGNDQGAAVEDPNKIRNIWILNSDFHRSSGGCFQTGTFSVATNDQPVTLRFQGNRIYGQTSPPSELGSSIPSGWTVSGNTWNSYTALNIADWDFDAWDA